MKKKRLFYIVSPGFSGSTLANLLLATHPDIATIGERTYIKRRLTEADPTKKFCTCGLPSSECEFLASAFEAGRRTLPWYMRSLNYSAFEFSRNKRVRRRFRRAAHRSVLGIDESWFLRPLARPYRVMCEANAALVDFVLESASANVFLDSSKSTVELEYLNASGLFDITPIHLSRDGRGQFHSALRHWPDLSPELAALRFRQCIERITPLLANWDGPYVRLRYEDLCEQPLKEIRRVAEETGLDPDGMSLDFRNRSRHIVGNVRVVESESREIVNEELWRTALSPQQLDTFEEISGDANRSLGYGA